MTNIHLCDDCKKKLNPNTVSILIMDEDSEKVVLFAANMTYDILSKLNNRIESYGFNRIQRIQDTLDHRLIRPLNEQRTIRGEKVLL